MAREYLGIVRSEGEATRQAMAGAGLNEGRIAAEYASGDPVDDPDFSFMPRFL
jgi:hypothetical protein